MQTKKILSEPDRWDAWIAGGVGVLALAAYVRTLAPDMLYGDSAELQTLVYTFGMTHSTGYPIYLLLARLMSFLPIGTFAWRVNFFSGFSAAITVACVYLLVRYVTKSRIAALLGCLALAMSYTFWSQAIIAEIYSPAMAFISIVMLLLWHWRSDPERRSRSLFNAALLSALGLGVHASVGLVAPAALAFVVWSMLGRKAVWAIWKRTLLAGFVGVLVGVSLLVWSFIALEIHNPSTSFNRVMTYPSRSFWDLTPADLDSPFERAFYSATALQWRDAWAPEGLDFWAEFQVYIERILSLDFSPLLLWAAILGVTILFWRAPGLATFLLVALSTMLYYVLPYQTGDKYVFYLPTYILIAVAAGSLLGVLLEVVGRFMRVDENRWRLPFYAAVGLILIGPVLEPHWPERKVALQKGLAVFMQEDYVFPRANLKEPRGMAQLTLAQVPDDAVLIMEWRDLYSTFYLAVVENESPDILIYEGMPRGNDGGVAASMIEEIDKHLAEGRPVFTSQPFARLDDHFKLDQLAASRWYRILPRK